MGGREDREKVYLGVERGERVVEQDDVGVGVGRARERDALLLPARHVHAAVAQLGPVARCGRAQIFSRSGPCMSETHIYYSLPLTKITPTNPQQQ